MTISNYRDSVIRVVVRHRMGLKALWMGLFYLADLFPKAPLPGSQIGIWVKVFCARRAFAYVGKDVTIHAGVQVGSGKLVAIGDYSSLNVGCSIANDTVIGCNVMMGPEVLIISGSHNFTRTDLPMREQGAPSRRPVLIGDDVWIGARSIILPGVVVGSHSIIGAGSIVTRMVPPFAIVAGNPARIVKWRVPPTDGRLAPCPDPDNGLGNATLH